MAPGGSALLEDASERIEAAVRQAGNELPAEAGDLLATALSSSDTFGSASIWAAVSAAAVMAAE
jgi:hypothetical protein